jgi:alanine dehydrogenase
MLRIGLIRERKVPADERVAFTPKQCAHLLETVPGLTIVVEPSPIRCYRDEEYVAQGIELKEDLSDCNLLIGIKEVPADKLIHGKTYLFFSHTKKKQPHNQKLMRALLDKHITMVDYECLTHEDQQRILGFGYYAGVVGAHNGIKAYGRKFGLYEVPAAHNVKNYQELLDAYEDVQLPPFKIVVTGSGRVASGVLDLMSQLDIEGVEPADFLTHNYNYPVFTHLKGAQLYARKDNDLFFRDDFHANPGKYKCLFSNYIPQSDILMNGIYWDHNIPPLFEREDIRRYDWRVSVIADITCDIDGSVPINVGSTTIADPVYGISRDKIERVDPYLDTRGTIDIMAVDNLPNELPRDASKYFGSHMEKFVLPELLAGKSDIIDRATICTGGALTDRYAYLSDYAAG